jgi:hypothetical protein
MIYYLEDHATYAVIFITDDVFLINNIRDGILDCHVKVFSTSSSTTETLIAHGQKTNNDTAIKITPIGPREFLLDNYPELKQKQELVKLRLPAFTALLDSSRKYRVSNQYGFDACDIDAIKYSLDNPIAVAEYARVMDMTPEFAQQELSMIVTSQLQDNFRIFTICDKWKKRINQATTGEEVAALLDPIKQSFWLAGIPDV